MIKNFNQTTNYFNCISMYELAPMSLYSCRFPNNRFKSSSNKKAHYQIFSLWKRIKRDHWPSAKSTTLPPSNFKTESPRNEPPMALH